MTNHVEEREQAFGGSGTAVVTVRSLTKRFGDLVAVDDLSFSLESGTITGFLGPNGAGKTTSLRVLLGLAEPTAGEALVFGRRYRDLDEPANGLDPAGVQWLRRFLRLFAEQGRTVLVSSHMLAEVAQTVDRVVILNRGRRVASGRLDELTGGGKTLEDTYLELIAREAS